MSKTEFFKVIVVPIERDDFRPCVLEYGVSLEKAEKAVRHYVNVNGLRFKKDGKYHPALVQIRRMKDPLPDGYFLLSAKGVKV